ncbi:WD40 repeat-like protein [Coniophora puteana RWD-64-598 SS2]|uniref:WD40 repeat-like protein n=1 Tax=Coniophora puteana (strain RWD-64-598) TaxID=741705 RepID=A0A5M3MLD3_CONPW|nr:WD40 repeat-like protein [Coniophora puteana RWD-64-598 SS2]EIW79866.1 WD40 repeat-like protein [Coniophora puteana RWD-64-598 SS2]
MPDAFFASSKTRKRKRVGADSAQGSAKVALRKSKGKFSGPSSSKANDEELSSDDEAQGAGAIDDLDLTRDDEPMDSGDELEDETPAQKRLRLAKLYLDGVRENLAGDEFDAAEIDRELISSRLREDVLEHKGKMHVFIADSIDLTSPPILRIRLPKPVTAAVATPDAHTLFAASKDGHITRWDISTPTPHRAATFHKTRPDHFSSASSSSSKSMPHSKANSKTKAKGKEKGKGKGNSAAAQHLPGHTAPVLALALSSDGRLLASGGADGVVGLWDAQRDEWVRALRGHRDAVAGVAWRYGAHTLFSASADRTVKVFDCTPSVLGASKEDDGEGKEGKEKEKGKGGGQWQQPFITVHPPPPSLLPQVNGASREKERAKPPALDPAPMGYIETLFGHQDAILGVAALRNEAAVTAGARDRTVRFWKIAEESQLVFRGGGAGKIREAIEGGGGEGDEEEGEWGGVDDESGKKEKKKEKGKERELRFVEGSMECVAMIDEATFISGGDTGSIHLWSTQKKKPVFTQPVAHGYDPAPLPSSPSSLNPSLPSHPPISTSTPALPAEDAQQPLGPPRPRWITALAALRYADLFASASWDGSVRLWRVEMSGQPGGRNTGARAFYSVGRVDVPGVVNSLQLVVPSGGGGVLPWAARQAVAGGGEGVNGVGEGGDDGDEGEEGMQVDGKETAGGKKGGKDEVPAALLVAGVGREHRMGRWVKVTGGGAANGVVVIALHKKS